MRFWTIIKRHFGDQQPASRHDQILEFMSDTIDTLHAENVSLLTKLYTVETEVAVLRGMVNASLVERQRENSQWVTGGVAPAAPPPPAPWGPFSPTTPPPSYDPDSGGGYR